MKYKDKGSNMIERVEGTENQRWIKLWQANEERSMGLRREKEAVEVIKGILR